MAESKIDWGVLASAVLLGLVIGVALGIGGRMAGLPSTWAAPITGATVGAMVPLIYRLRMSRRG